MSLPPLRCPHCQSLLRPNRPVPPGTAVRCPECRAAFAAADDSLPDDDFPPAPRLFGPAFFIAVGIAGTLGLSIITAAVIFASRPAAPVAAVPSPQPPAAAPAAPDTGRAELDRERKGLDAARLTLKGDAALAKGQFADAITAFESALKLSPDSPDAASGLASARAGADAARKSADAQEKRQQSVAALVADAKKASADKKHADAVRALESARQLDPANTDVLAALTAARAARDADQADKKAAADFRAHVDAGQVAMRAERYADALREYLAAVRLMPDDLEAQAGQKQAESKLAVAADQKKKQAAFDDLLTRGQAAVKATRYGDAIPSLEAALRLVPDDKAATRELRDARAALKRARTANAKLLAQADEAVKLGRTAEARKLLDQAVANWAEDAKAKAALAGLGKAGDTAETAREAFVRLNQQAALAMTGLRYADAVGYYNDALRLYPNDAEVLLALRRARAALAAEAQAIRESDRLVRRGSLELGRKAFAEAEKTFRQALRQAPDNAQAIAGLSEARFGKAMAEGTAAFRARKKAEAVRAFEAALAEKPNDATAANALRQARALR